MTIMSSDSSREGPWDNVIDNVDVSQANKMYSFKAGCSWEYGDAPTEAPSQCITAFPLTSSTVPTPDGQRCDQWGGNQCCFKSNHVTSTSAQEWCISKCLMFSYAHRVFLSPPNGQTFSCVCDAGSEAFVSHTNGWSYSSVSSCLSQ